MAFVLDDVLGLIGLIAALTSTGIGVGKSAAQSSEESKMKRLEEDAKRTEKKNRELANKEARRKAVAAAIGSRLNVFKNTPEPIEPYKPRDYSGFDTARQIAGATGQLASGLSQDLSSKPEGIDSGATVTGNEPSMTDVQDVPPAQTDINDVPGTNTALGKKPYSRYGSYLSQRTA